MMQTRKKRTANKPVLPVWSSVGPLWTVGAPMGWMSHSAPAPVSLAQPQKEEKSKLQANQTYAKTRRREQTEVSLKLHLVCRCVTRLDWTK